MKLYCWITGDDYEVVNNQDVKSRKKIKMYGLGIFLPTTIWLVVGFLLMNSFFEISYLGSAIAALFIASLIFLIERLIIMQDGGKGALVVRLILGLAISMIGSVIIDECFFSKDLDNRMMAYRQSELQAYQNLDEEKFNDEINQMVQERDILYNDWRVALKDASSEADGSNGSGKSGVGQIARLKLDIAREKENAFSQMDDKIIKAKESRNEFLGLSEKTFNQQFNDHSIITRVEVMFLLFKESNVFKAIWSCFTILVMTLEFFIIILKLSSKKTVYEQRLAFEEALAQEKLEDMIRRREALKLYRNENSLLI